MAQKSALTHGVSAVGKSHVALRLVEALGGPATPAVGFGTGIERVLLACDAEGALGDLPSNVQVFVVDVVDGEAARGLTTELRRAGIGADRAFDGKPTHGARRVQAGSEARRARDHAMRG